MDDAAEKARADLRNLTWGPDGIPTTEPPGKSDEENAERHLQVRHNLTCRDFPCSDLGNSFRFTVRKNHQALYCPSFKSWFIWDGKRWARDIMEKSLEFAKDVALRIPDEAGVLSGDSAARVFRWAATSQARPRIDAMLYLAKSAMAVRPDDLDAHPHLLNLQNGTLNLKTFELVSPKKKDHLTKLADVSYDPQGECPLWISHLNLIFNQDTELIDAFQFVVGYSLLQDNPEQVMFILFGNGKNGKSKTIEVLVRTLGDYAVNIASESLMTRKYNEGPRGDIARISNARLVSVSEGESGGHLAESLIKSLTGGDAVTVRRLYENEFEFRPTPKIWMATNHLPVIQGTDDAIWRRIWLIPFTVQIPEEKRDPDIVTKLLRERSGILNWALNGLKKYREAGRLVQPEKVKAATQDYRQDSDILGEFIQTYCVMSGSIRRGELYRAYESWCDTNHDKPVSSKRFITMIRERGIRETRDVGGNWIWVNLSLRRFGS
ncbi:MAG: phage/plasmid primase, P4 family [Methanoregulaceae archaeon]